MEEEIKYSTFLRSGKMFTRRLVTTNKTHNMSYTRIYSIWKGMRYRCCNPNRPKYEYYGGKGIKVCDAWNHGYGGFENFYDWSMKNGYDDTLTIDRINSDMDYCPDNCRWIPFYDNLMYSLLKKRIPKCVYTGINEKLNVMVIFYKREEFADKFKIDNRRISDCCNGKKDSYKGWVFSRKELSAEERQETIRLGSTWEDEFPMEVQSIH